MEAKTKKHPLKRLIALEEHFTLPDLSARVIKYLTGLNGGVSPVSDTQRKLMQIVLPDDAISEIGARRLAYMDAAGISVQVLSYGPMSPQNLPDTVLAAELCAEANDRLSKLIAEHPTRFAGFALLPMSAPDKAAAELERAVRQLGFKGAMISGSMNGTFFDAPQFMPVFEKDADLGVPLFMHPAIISNKVVVDYYFKSDAWSDVAGTMFATAGYGWHADSGIALLRLILSGLFDKLPTLQIISGHWGELVPFYLNRLDDQQSKTLSLNQPISAYFKQNIYVCPSGFFNEHQLVYCANELGASHILFACDYPFLQPTDGKAFLEKSPLSKEDKERIAYKNTEKLPLVHSA